jgi:hypothetical protein
VDGGEQIGRYLSFLGSRTTEEEEEEEEEYVIIMPWQNLCPKK